MAVNKYNARLVETIDETSPKKGSDILTRTFRLKAANNENIEFLPGQYFVMEYKGIKNSYSVSSAPGAKTLDFTIQLTKKGEDGQIVIGKTTKILSEASLGDSFIIQGPVGKMVLDSGYTGNLVLLAGGIGITPFMSFIRHIIGCNLKNKVNLFYSIRCRQENIAFYNELTDLSRKFLDRFRCHFTLTQVDDSYTWKHHVGRIGADVIKNSSFDWQNSLYYICGSRQFVTGLKEMLIGMGIEKDKIRHENFY
jgi:glycine betaine catabolism B